MLTGMHADLSFQALCNARPVVCRQRRRARVDTTTPKTPERYGGIYRTEKWRLKIAKRVPPANFHQQHHHESFIQTFIIFNSNLFSQPNCTRTKHRHPGRSKSYRLRRTYCDQPAIRLVLQNSQKLRRPVSTSFPV